MIALKYFIIFAGLNAVSSANILFLNGIASPSHHLWNRVLIRGLASKGHNITMVSVDDDQNPPANVHYIFLEAVYSTVYNGSSAVDLLEMSELGPLTAIFSNYEWCRLCCDGIANSKGLDSILNYPNNFRFDAVIYDFTAGPCLLPLIHKFGYPPLISVTAFSHPIYTSHLLGGQKYPAYVPHFITSYTQHMTFPQRAFNFLLYAVDAYIHQHMLLPSNEKKIRERVNFKDFPSFDVLQKKTSILLVNSDNAIDNLEPLAANTIQVGGLQITDPKQLASDLLEFVEKGVEGTILMSLGTNIKSSMLSRETQMSILKAFAHFKDYNFIWKFETDTNDLPMKPSGNVLIKSFVPQNDILAHPNVKAFITHSGLLSTQESFWYGKPMVAIPFFCDQRRTAEKSKAMGVGVNIDFQTLTKGTLITALEAVLYNKSFTENAQKFSKLFRDKPQKPLDVALWWIEYAMRNPSAPHYRSPTLELGSFVSQSYDVILAILILIHTLTFMLFKLINCIWRYFNVSGKFQKTQKSKRN